MKRHPDTSDSGSPDAEPEPESAVDANRSSGPGPSQGRSESRADKLARIRRDIAAGRYDSQELLENALEIMRRRLQEPAES